HHGGVATQVVTIDITGTNDAPTFTAHQDGAVSEGDDNAARSEERRVGKEGGGETSDSHSLSVSGAASYGTASVDQDGTWHYTVSDSGAVDALAVGTLPAVQSWAQPVDHHGGVATQVVTIDITGTNDAPTFTVHQDGAVSEGDDNAA